MYGTSKPKTVCQLDSGERVEYDAAGDSPESYDPNVFTYFGDGFIYSVDGIVQTQPEDGPRRLSFFKRTAR
jgi:hypothetical protein